MALVNPRPSGIIPTPIISPPTAITSLAWADRKMKLLSPYDECRLQISWLTRSRGFDATHPTDFKYSKTDFHRFLDCELYPIYPKSDIYEEICIVFTLEIEILIQYIWISYIITESNIYPSSAVNLHLLWAFRRLILKSVLCGKVQHRLVQRCENNTRFRDNFLGVRW